LIQSIDIGKERKDGRVPGCGVNEQKTAERRASGANAPVAHSAAT